MHISARAHVHIRTHIYIQMYIHTYIFPLAQDGLLPLHSALGVQAGMEVMNPLLDAYLATKSGDQVLLFTELMRVQCDFFCPTCNDIIYSSCISYIHMTCDFMHTHILLWWVYQRACLWASVVCWRGAVPFAKDHEMLLHHATSNQAGLEVVKALIHTFPDAASTLDQVRCRAMGLCIHVRFCMYTHVYTHRHRHTHTHIACVISST